MSDRLWEIALQHDLSLEDKDMAQEFIGSDIRKPDLVIAPDGRPYIYRWYLTPEAYRHQGATYFHIQVLSDPERPLHDHPRDNQSVILSGGYDEMWNPTPHMTPEGHEAAEYAVMRPLRKGDTVARKAEEAHRLILPPDIPYTMTLFSIGPNRREWGYWTKNGFVNADTVVSLTPDGRSIYLGEKA